MRRSFYIGCLIFICCFAFFLSFPFSKRQQSSLGTQQQLIPLQSDLENEKEEQDGILEAQQMEFELTRDVNLGYVPKYRLIEAYQDIKLMATRPNSVEGTSAFTWTERGPDSDVVGPSNGNGRVTAGQVTSGRMRAIWMDLADPTDVWVGGIDGGLWKTNDITADPATWTLVTDLSANIAIADIVQDPTNNDIMYFGTGERSINSDAVMGGGIWKSTDHGVTWNLLGNTTSFWNCSRLAMDNAGNLYVALIPSLVGASGSVGGIYRSTDDGATWSANISPTGLSDRISEMVISSTGRMHITCGYYNTPALQAGYRYTDNPATVSSGAGWSAAATSFTPVEYMVDLAVAGTTLYALPASSSFQTPQVWKSTDGGVNWAITTTTPPTGGATPVSSGQAWYNLAIGVDPSNANNVMVGGLNSYRSIDGGITWTANSVWVTGVPGSANYIHADHHIIVWNNNQVLDGGDGGIFYSGDDGLTWSDRNVGLRLKQFYSVAIHPSTTNYFLGGTQDNGTHQLNGAGLTSSVEVTGGDGAFSHIDQDEPQYQFGAYVYSNYRLSTDGGASWSNINFGNTGRFINPTDYDNTNDRFYGAWAGGQYFRCDDPQGAWGSAFAITIAALNGASISHVNVSPYTSNRVFFGTGGTNGARVVRVDNAESGSPTGTNITGSTMPASPNSVSCIAIGTNDNNLLVTFSNYGLTSNRIWVSTTGGGAAGWTNITGNFPDIPIRWAMFYPGSNTRAFLATDLGFYETTQINGGSTNWVRDAAFPTVRIDMFQYRASDQLLAAGTHGRGIWTTTVPILLPVTLSNFEGRLVNEEIPLSWKTASEENSKHFELEKSTDGVNFQRIALVNAAGNSVSDRVYRYTDRQVSEYNYYRLRMVDLDGRFTYSNTILIKHAGIVQAMKVLNNPFSNFIDLRFTRIPGERINIDLMNMAGVILYRQEFAANDRIRIDLSMLQVPRGVYILRSRIGNNQYREKLIKQ